MWRFNRNYLFFNVITNNVYQHLIKYPTPINLNYLWNFGFMAGIFLVVQILSGVFLTFFYTPHIELAFYSVERLMRDVNFGWFIRYIHMNGASFFFFVIYIHILKGIYYGSYYFPRNSVWFIGCLMYIILMGTAFLGYVLPWGQMSYWGATVITNLLTVIPTIGVEILHWVWGGYSINNATLNRFYSFHYMLPFLLALLSMYHIYQLHKSGSSNELGTRSNSVEKISFYPYFIVKDLFGVCLVFLFFLYIVGIYPEIFNHSDNYENANPIVTPTHIVPEWYLLPFYAILRSILDKTYGILIMFVSILVIFLLPFVDKSTLKSKSFQPLNRILFWFFVFNFVFLGYLGSEDPDTPFIELGLMCGHIHLLYFFLFIPMNVLIEYTFISFFLRTYKFGRNSNS
uniref:Cytochrome b n=1 Tax=Pleurostomum flabellatum TaxID=405751 RepID=A0A7T0M4H4_9EUKA|nr:cytochrome b [Pleurostomum flabellatum]QPL15599.1 cytochrome b [Pleurostomum flabellatum]